MMTGRAPLAAVFAAVLAACGGATPMESTTPSSESVPFEGGRAEDVPRPDPVRVGLAGAALPDVVRYLIVRSAYAPSPSPEGTYVAFRSRISGRPQLWVVAAEGGWPRQLTFGESVTFHAWSPSGDQILYGSDRGGNEREAFYLISPDGTRERELLPPSEAFREFGGFSDDGSRIAYGTTERNGRDFDIHVLDVRSGEDRRVFEGRMGLYPIAWRPDGEALVLSEARGEDANDLHLLEIASGTLTPLFTPAIPSAYSSVAWEPDGRGFYLTTDQGRDFSGLARVSMPSGELAFLETPERDVEVVRLSRDGRYLLWTENDGGFSALHLRDLREGVEVPMPEGLPRGIVRPRFALNATTVCFSIGSPRIPGDIWTWQIGGALHRTTQSSMAGIDPESLVMPTHIDFPARDGVTLHGLLYLPPGVERAPVLLAVHGGPTAQARPDFDAIHQYLLARGIAVFDLNFRGSTGYGKAFARLDNLRLRPNAVLDMEDALGWLGTDGRVDADRAAVMGGSYGGYMTFAALTRFPERFRGGVSFVGVSNWVTALESASPQLQASDRLEYGDIHDADDRAFFRELSPITHVDRVVRPLLVSHGANDPRDPVSESDHFVSAVRSNGVEVDYLRFADEGHGVRRIENRVHLYRRVAEFLERVLR